MTNVEEILNAFGKEVLRQSRSNLTRQGKRDTNGLYKNIDFELDVFKNSFSMDFGMRIGGRLQKGYMDFVDQGVSGTEKKYNTPYSFRNKMPPRKNILEWVNRKRLRLRDPETGRFKKGGQNSLAYLIQRSIFKKGIRPSMFFTRAFENAFRQLPDELEEAFALDVEDLIEFTFRKNNINTQ